MILVQTEEQFNAALNVLRQAKVVAFDTETYGKRGTPVKHPAQGNRLIGLSAHCVMPPVTPVSDRQGADQQGADQYEVGFYIPFRHEADDKVLNLFTISENLPLELLPKLAEVLNRPDLRLVFHHLKFDAQMLRADNLLLTPTPDRVACTMAKAQLVDENMSHKLEDVAAMIYGDKAREPEREIRKIVRKQHGYHKTTPKQMAPYACQDAQSTFGIEPYLDRSIEQQGLGHLVPRDTEFQLALMEMEWEGIDHDLELAQRLSNKTQRRLREIEDELGFDPASRDQVAHVLFGLPESGGLGLPYSDTQKNVSREFPMGVPVMDQQVLVGLRNETAERILEYRGIAKADGTWYQGWIKRRGMDGRIHPTYNVSETKEKFGTVTSRLSSYIQQMPRDPRAMVKLTLRPAPGYVMVEFDYNQIEYRLGVSYSGDPILTQQFQAGIDVHQELADQLGVDRQTAKPIVYTILFGGQGPGVARNLERHAWTNERRIISVPDSEGQALVNAYYTLHPKMKEVAYLAKHNAGKYGFVQLWNGRRRHFKPEEKWHHRKAFNSVLQGGAAQILVTSMLEFHRLRDVRPYRMRLQVHDSIWFEVPVDGFDMYCHEIQSIMEWPTQKFPVPFPVDSKIIRHRELDNIHIEGVSDELLGVGPRGNDGMGDV